MSRQTNELLALAAELAADRPRYLGFVLQCYADSEGLSRNELADHLGVTAEGINDLALCYRPRAATFAQDVIAIAGRSGADVSSLATIVRYVDALEALPVERAASAERGALLAARERREKSESEPKAPAQSQRSNRGRNKRGDR